MKRYSVSHFIIRFTVPKVADAPLVCLLHVFIASASDCNGRASWPDELCPNLPLWYSGCPYRVTLTVAMVQKHGTLPGLILKDKQRADTLITPPELKETASVSCWMATHWR